MTHTTEGGRGAGADFRKDASMKLYAWQPNGHGELSWFVMAETEADAKAAVEKEMVRRKALAFDDIDRITNHECSGWGTDYYTLTVVDVGVVLVNDNI